MRHDYTSSATGWGHAIGRMVGGTTAGDVGRWIGHGPRAGARIARGDQIAVTMGSGKTGLFRVETIDYLGDPPDMWDAQVTFLAYEDA